MPAAQYVAGLDVGTTKICTIIAQPAADGTLDILGVGMAPSAGVKHGGVVDRQDVMDVIAESVAEAERMAGLPVRGAYVGITGDHIVAYNETGRVHVDPSGEVTAAAVEQAVQSACDSVPAVPDREIIHRIARDFAIDGQEDIKRPIGMSGYRLDARVHIVTGTASVRQNLVRCVEEVGIEVQRCILEPVATSLAVLTAAERELGVVLIDIGGGTTDIAVFRHGAICHSGSVPVAGNYMTRDLAHLLRIDQEEAEALKRRFGLASGDIARPEELVQITEMGTGEQARVPRRLIGEIIQPRLDEILLLVRENLQRAETYDMIAGGVVLTGGGSQLYGSERLASAILWDLPVRRGSPRNLGKLADSVSSPIYSTGVGLALHAASEGAYAGESIPSGRPPWLAALSQWWSQQVRPHLTRYLPSATFPSVPPAT